MSHKFWWHYGRLRYIWHLWDIRIVKGADKMGPRIKPDPTPWLTQLRNDKARVIKELSVQPLSEVALTKLLAEIMKVNEAVEPAEEAA